MELRKDLELVNVEYNGKKAVMTFLDREAKAVRIVNFNQQVYDREKGGFIDSAEKAEQVEKWCQDYFGLSFATLTNAIGTLHDVYVYENFNSLWESEQVMKFSADMLGQIYQTSIESVDIDDYAIRVRYKIDGQVYESKMSYGVYQEAMKEWFVDPLKKARQYDKFLTKFGVPVEEAQSIVGHPLMVEVKMAMGKYVYGEMKNFPKSK